MIKNTIRACVIVAGLFSLSAAAQTLPPGELGTVTANTPNTWQTFTYTFTPSQTGANFIGFAFRQDPAFWTFDNVSLVVQGTTTNLATNGDFTTGGSFSVTTNNGVSSIQAPTNWGVWYQNGTYPAAAGSWSQIGGSHGGVWYDGAVGTFDGIYQGVQLTAGTTYTISFEVSGNNTANTSSIQLGIYGGACADVSIAASGCTIPASVGFTTLATPAQGAAAGGPTGPVAINNPSATTANNPAGTTTLAVTNAGTYTNDGVNGDVSNTGTFTNNNTTGTVNNQSTGTFTNSTTGTTGAVTNAGTLTNNGTTGDVTNTGTFTNGILGTIANLINSLFATNNGTITGTVTNNQGGTFNNTGTVQGATTNAGDLTNTGTLASLDNSGTATNSGTVSGATVNSGIFTNSGTTGGITNTGTVTNTGTAGAVTNNTGGTFNNNVGGTTGAVVNAGAWINRGTVTTVNNTGTFTNHSTGTTGAFTNSGTLTNSGTAASLANTGTATNSGTITGAVTNTGGTFTNSGTTGAVTNSATVNNTGTTGAVTNNTGGTFNNNVGGVTAAVTNVATFNNRGTVTTVNNSGTFTNHSTGTTGAFTNSGTLTNAGSIASLNNSGTTSNDGVITGDVTNSGTFSNGILGTIANLINSLFATNNGTITGNITNNAGGTFNNTGSGGILTNNAEATAAISGTGSIASANNSGTLNIRDTASTGNILNLVGGLLVFNGTGTVGIVDNSGVFNFAGSGSINSLTNTGTTSVAGNVTTGDINNSGIIHLNTVGATIGNVNNTGVLNIATAGGDVTVNEFSQASPGLLAMAGLQKFNINGPVNLGGSMMIINSPTAFGRYLMINGQPVTGTFASLNINPGIDPLGSYLKYGSNTVHYYVTPSAQSTKDSLSMVQQDSAKINNLVAGRTSGALGNDCGTFGPTGGCIGFNFSTSKAITGDLRSGNMVISTRLGQILTDHYRVGIFLDRAFTKPTIGTVQYKNVGPIVGGFAGWNANLDGTGLGIVGSMAKTNTGTYIIQRPQLDYAEAGSTAIPTNSLAYQVKASYSVPIYGSLTATPYLGIRHTKLYVDGYTEAGAVFPLSIDSYKQITSDLLGGVSFSMPITRNITASVSAGLVRNLTNTPGSISGTSEIHNMFTFETKNPGKKYTSGALGAGLTYEFIPNHKVGVNVGWQQRSLIDMNVKSFGLNYTVGF